MRFPGRTRSWAALAGLAACGLAAGCQHAPVAGGPAAARPLAVALGPPRVVAAAAPDEPESSPPLASVGPPQAGSGRIVHTTSCVFPPTEAELRRQETLFATGPVSGMLPPPEAIPSATVRTAEGPVTVQRVAWRGLSFDGKPRPTPVVPASTAGPVAPVGVAVATVPDEPNLARELRKAVLPAYVLEPPDVIRIEGPEEPAKLYRLAPGDELRLEAPAEQVLPNMPIRGLYTVDSVGRIDLGYRYGAVDVGGRTAAQAAEAVRGVLRDKGIIPPNVTASLGRTRPIVDLTGAYRVQSDGTVPLGPYGDVVVVGKTLAEARQALDERLGAYFASPGVAVEVLSSPSKAIYLVLEDGQGQRVMRVPYGGGETVLDAVACGVSQPLRPGVRQVWVARPAPGEAAPRLLTVDWEAVVQGASTATNWQLFPGDRVCVRLGPGAVTVDAAPVTPIQHRRFRGWLWPWFRTIGRAGAPGCTSADGTPCSCP